MCTDNCGVLGGARSYVPFGGVGPQFSRHIITHVDNVVGSSAQSMYAISVLRSHGMQASALQQVFRAVVVSKLTTSLRRGGALRPPSIDSVSMLFCVQLLGLSCGHWLGCLTRIRSRTSAVCNLADDELFIKIRKYSNHILHGLLPPPSTASQNYNLRQRAHSFQLPERSTHLSDCNFLMRMMYKNSY